MGHDTVIVLVSNPEKKKRKKEREKKEKKKRISYQYIYRNSQTSIKASIHTRNIKRKKVRAFNTPATEAEQKPKTAVVLVKQVLVQNQHTSRARNILTTQGSVLKTITTLAHYNGSKGETRVAQTTDQ